jgi:hypothetical protein
VSNHGHVTPRPDGVKARCGGPALCSECAKELAQKPEAQPVKVGARVAAAALALKPLGLHLLVSPPDQFVITDKPDDPCETVICYPTIEMVEKYIADCQEAARRHDKPAPRRPRVADTAHYVSYGTPVREDGSQAYASLCRAAMITEVTGDTVGLMVANPTGQFFNQGVPFGDGDTLAAGPTNLCGGLYFPGGSWHWAGHE